MQRLPKSRHHAAFTAQDFIRAARADSHDDVVSASCSRRDVVDDTLVRRVSLRVGLCGDHADARHA
jgi:hypothetical protein